MSFEPLDYLRHILVEVEYLLDQSQRLVLSASPPRDAAACLRTQLGGYR
jgi:hypothetical protein